MLSWEFPPAVTGGLGKHVYELSKHLVTSGHKVIVVTLNTLGAPSFEEVEGIRVQRIKDVNPTYKDFHLYIAMVNMNMVETVRNLSKTYNFDIIHAHDWQVGLAARALKSYLNIPLVTTIHALELGRSNLETILQKRTYMYECQLIQNSNSIIVCSSYMKTVIEESYHSNTDIHVIPNGITHHSLKSNSMEEFLKQYDYSHLILFLGRMVPEKGVETLLHAAEEIISLYPSSLFILAGKGPMLEVYKNIVKNKDLEESILFIGFLNENEKATALYHCDILVVPSLYEPFGIVALEGMAAKKTVIAAKTGGLTSIISDEKNGLLFEPSDAVDLAEKLKHLLNHPVLCRKLGENAKQEVREKYKWEDVREHTEALYTEIVTTSSIK
ncbi:glycosyltransferase family 4 protein [Sutcliffiella rhizosphaerae]|uniref:glycosyltransferase family 4 protein n=1 Tax=Sutcliffiella rhizosphaerae TaxID=2880967 RepID=UPI001E2BF1BC|nr:glycosyltransferase family 4 protein [Sutcliffiella rhizosphaerae]